MNSKLLLYLLSGILSITAIQPVWAQSEFPHESRACEEAARELGEMANGKTGDERRRPWLRRHPILTTLLGVGAVGVGTLGYFAPVYPSPYHRDNSLELGLVRIDLPGQSAGFNQIARWMDARYYKGSASFNAQQLEAFYELQEKLVKIRPNFQVRDSEIPSQRRERNRQLAEASEEQFALYRNIAEYFAPNIFQDANWFPVADTSGLVFSDQVPFKDIPLSINFDADGDARNNVQSISQWAQTGGEGLYLAPSIYQRVRESETHYFVEYVAYYPFNDFSEAKYSVSLFGAFPDPSSFNHEQDIEHQLIFIRKTEDGRGEFEGLLTFRHGYLDAYHPDRDIQKIMRENLGKNLGSPKDVLNISLGPLYQPHAIRHGRSAKDTFMFDESLEGAVAGINLYSARMGHAYMGIDFEALRRGYGDVAVLMPASRLEGQDVEAVAPQRIYPYQLLSWTDFVSENMGNNAIFEGSMARDKMEAGDEVLQVRRGLPESIVRGLGDSEARTVLPSAASGRSPHSLAFPHAVLEFLTEGIENRQPISGVYIFNPDVQVIEP